MLYLKAWAANAGKGGNFDKKNAFDKKNVVLGPESLKAWVAKTLKPKSLNIQPKNLKP